MKKIFISLFVVIAITTLQANAFDWVAALKFWDRATEAQIAEVQQAKMLTDIQTQMATIDKSVQEALVNIASELSTKKEVKNIKSQINSSNADIVNIISNYTASLANNKENFVKTVKKLSEKEKTTLINNLGVLSEDAQQYLLLATDGAKAASSALKSSQRISEAAVTLSNINSMAANLKNRATAVMNLANQIKTIATTAGVSVN